MRTILVTGATGQQGGAVVRALQAANVPDVKIRVLTRNPQSSAAQALKAQDVETSIGNLNNILSLEAALYDCEVAYLVTDFRGPGDVQGEVEQGQNFVIAAKRAGRSYTFSRFNTLI
jgi:uncharacterized protein YbjT (DUF2867 family)